MNDRVCAVVVTQNRLPILRLALAALLASSRAVDDVLLVVNPSDDGTAEAVAAEFPHVRQLLSEINIGSAGGYNRGIARAVADGFDWIWTLDDDTIVSPHALRDLLLARDRFPSDCQPRLLASRVDWTDGTLHPMNIQKAKLYDPAGQFIAAAAATMSIRFSSFVSMLVHRSLIEQQGLPIAEYFLWNDDVEWSARLLRDELGVVVPTSVVVHQTPLKHVPAAATGGKYYFEVRNKLWIILHSAAFSRSEKWWMLRSLIRRTALHLRDNSYSKETRDVVLNGIRDGGFSSPISAKPK